MASSQVEVVASSPFGSVLRDRNRQDRCRDSNVRAAQAAFEKNLKELVRDHLNTCVSISDENSQNQNTSIDSWIANGQRNTNRRSSTHRDVHVDSSQLNNPRQSQSQIIDRLAARQAREIASTIEKQAQEAIILPSSNSAAASTSPPHSNGSSPRASSLVQIWEARLNRTGSGGIQMNSNQCQTSRTCSGFSSNENSPRHPVLENPIVTGGIPMNSKISQTSRTISGLSSIENSPPHPVGKPSQNSELCESTTNNEDSSSDWESQSDRTALGEGPPLLNGERERVRVADIIKRLINGSEDSIVQEQGNNVSDHSPPREVRNVRVSKRAEQGGFAQVLSSSRLRGRQALHNFVMHMEQDRHKELHSLVERQVVSKFPQRGRIQSMLRLRWLQRGLEIPLSSGAEQNKTPSKSAGEQNKNPSKSAGAEVNGLPQGSTIMQLREKFNSSKENVMTVPSHVASARIHCKEVANSTLRSDTPSTSNPPSEDVHQSTLPRKPPVAPLPENSHPAWHQTTLPEKRTVSPSNEDRHPKEMSSSRHQTTLPELLEKHSVENKNECVAKQGNPHSDVACQTTRLEATNLDTQKTTEASTSLAGQEENQIAKEKYASSQQHLDLASQPTGEGETIASSNSPVEIIEMAKEGDANNHQHPYLDSHEIVETTTSANDWDENDMAAEEEDDDYQQYFEQANYNWFRDIARPRSYWENRRQAWYQEVLNTTSKDEEIHQLLERRRVSTFLTSDFRDKMDQLVMSRVKMQAEQGESQEDESDEEERIHQVMSHLRRHLHVSGSQGGEERGEDEEEEETEEEQVEEGEVEDDDDDDDEDGEEEEEEEEEEEHERGSTVSHQSHEATDYCDQSSPSIMPSPSLLMSWSYHDDNEIGNDSDRVPSRFSTGLPPSQAQSFQGSQQSSHRPSLEMELICDLRGHMEQLYREMAQLRKSILSCTDMQMKMQQSFNQEVHSVLGPRKNQPDRALLKRTSCICCEMQVDSLLYRCGHMCTCLKCAHELQWSSGKCPICRAQIVDVVRAYVDS